MEHGVHEQPLGDPHQQHAEGGEFEQLRCLVEGGPAQQHLVAVVQAKDLRADQKDRDGCDPGPGELPRGGRGLRGEEESADDRCYVREQQPAPKERIAAHARLGPARIHPPASQRASQKPGACDAPRVDQRTAQRKVSFRSRPTVHPHPPFVPPCLPPPASRPTVVWYRARSRRVEPRLTSFRGHMVGEIGDMDVAIRLPRSGYLSSRYMSYRAMAKAASANLDRCPTGRTDVRSRCPLNRTDVRSAERLDRPEIIPRKRRCANAQLRQPRARIAARGRPHGCSRTTGAATRARRCLARTARTRRAGRAPRGRRGRAR